MASSDRSERIRDLFDEVVDLERLERDLRLRDGCGDDPDLRRAVESLLEAEEARGRRVRRALEGLQPSEETTAEEPVPEPIPAALRGALADRYALERVIGRGGTATVYLAHDRKSDGPVALKVLKPELSATVGGERFLREITLTSRLQHPHILPLLDSGEADGWLYYVMPYVEGESLRGRLKREKQLPLKDALQIVREVALALSDAHGKGIVHRDIKPENILLAGGHVRVGDFGIARALAGEGAETLTDKGFAVGTVAYMSPEQASGERHLDVRTDVYSLGCVVYEMLAGEQPFTGATPEAVLARKALGAMPILRVVREGVPEAIERAIMKSLARAPADRFASISEFADALEGGGNLTAPPGKR